MTQTKFTLSWNMYQKNFCKGLGLLQQNGEFVDMTMAADGHHVKVHQLVLSLASPYLKALITSIQCQHPVIFLNNVSHKTLCSILEYVYTGEVVVAQEDIESLMEAGTALKIKGLENMNVGSSINTSLVMPNMSRKTEREATNIECTVTNPLQETAIEDSVMKGNNYDTLYDDTFYVDNESVHELSDSETFETSNIEKGVATAKPVHEKAKSSTQEDNDNVTLQYTLSNQGSLQLILNRFLYYLRYNGKGTGSSTRRVWRCVDYIRSRCPASIVTTDNVVVQRIAAHIHPFHDSRILKKVRNGAVFTAILDAEKKGEDIKKNKQDSYGDTLMEHDDEPK